MASHNRWSEWWWLGLAGWSADERRARLVLFAGVAAVCAAFASIALIVTRNQSVLDPGLAILMGLPMALPFALFYTRDLGRSIFPDVIKKGDEAAARRVGGHVRPPTRTERIMGWWWISSYNVPIRGWSQVEIEVRSALVMWTLFILLVPFVILTSFLPTLGMNDHYSVGIALFVSLPLAGWIAPRVYRVINPDKMKAAEDNVIKRRFGAGDKDGS